MAKTALKINYPDFEVESVIDPEFKKDLDKITHDHLTESNTARTIRNIRKNISATIKANYGITDKEHLTKITDGLLKIHGLHEDNFDFMKNFEDGVKDTSIVDHTIDANANKNEKVMVGYLNEVLNPGKKLIGMDMLYRTMKDLYGRKEAKKLTGEMYSLSLGLSDSTSILVPYSYYKHTPIMVRCNGIVKYITMKKLYDAYEEFATYNVQYDMYEIDTKSLYKAVFMTAPILKGDRQKVYKSSATIDKSQTITEQHNIEVWDNSCNKWVKLLRVVKHKNERDFIIYQTKSGHFAFVTEDHPVIMEDGSEKRADQLNEGDYVMVNYNIPSFDKYINVPSKLAYLMGFIKGDGFIKGAELSHKNVFDDKGCIEFKRSANSIVIYQNNVEQSYIYKIAKEVFPNAHFFKFSNDAKTPSAIGFSSQEFNALYSYYFGNDYRTNSAQKCLPNNFIHWTEDSVLAYLAGVIDSDGSVWKNDGRCQITLKSMQVINVLYDVLHTIPSIKGINKRVCVDKKNNYNTLMFSIGFNPRECSALIEYSQKLQALKHNNPTLFTKPWCNKSSWKTHSKDSNKIARIIRFNQSDITPTNKLYNELDYVYDITTETGRFYANGMVQHNCWALDASKLVTVGRDFGVLPSKPCKRVSSYISALCETIHQMSAHLAGAIAIGTFFLDLAHICIYKERRTLDELKNDKRFRKYVENELQQFIHSVNHLSRNGVESPFTNVSIFDSIKLKMLIGEDNYGWYFENHKAISTDNDLKDKMSNEQFQQYVIDYIMELQNIFMDFFEKGDPLNNGLPYRFPVSTVNFSKSDELKIEDDKFIKAFCKRDVSRFNIFGSKGTKIASCCRLCNNGELLEVASQVNSFGGGGSVSMGSHRVCTINFQRIALECNSIDDYYNILRTRVEEAAKILRAHKLLILKLTEQGFESFISNGYINPNRLFSTFGMLGIYEAKKTLHQRFDISNDVDITNEILVRFNQWVNEISKQYGIIGNIEQIPGETFAVRLAKADQLIYGYGDDYYKLYANQFCPLYEDFSLFEKLESDGKYNQLLTGGGIVHIQVASDTTPQQNEALIRKACSVGCEHFAINKVFSKCKKCGHVVNYKEAKCYECGSEEFTYMTRVVGFFTPVDSWNKTRREWEFPRRHFTDMSVLKQS